MKSPRTVQELVDTIASGETPKFVFFWGHQPSLDGTITKSCFSQWWTANFTVGDFEYPTAEHYMMASKARLFADEESFQRILAAKHPKQAKDIGRAITNFDEDTWVKHRFEVVVEGNFAKFSQHPELAEFLLATRTRVLVEASPVDRIWGIGLPGDSQDAPNPSRWRGLNLLGFALMEVRERLAKTQSYQ